MEALKPWLLIMTQLHVLVTCRHMYSRRVGNRLSARAPINKDYALLMITSFTRSISIFGHHRCVARSLVDLSEAPRAALRCLRGSKSSALRPKLVFRGKGNSFRHEHTSSQNSAAIIVEGYADKVAVQRAVSCAVSSRGI